MQTILGAGGAIGIPLAKELVKYSDKIRLVGRNPKKVNSDDELVRADITDYTQTLHAVKGSDIVYLVAGLKYDLKVWQVQWPEIMKNVIACCIEYKSKLVFLDNVYLYGNVTSPMTEDSRINPCSRKGEIRAQIAKLLINEFKYKSLDTVIVRSADFYGPDVKSSPFNLLIIDKFKQGKSAKWLINDKVKHTFTYTYDAASATALIGNTPEAYNQTWHLPSDKNALTGEEYIKLTAEIMGVKPKWSVYRKWQLNIAGLFNPTIKELLEMSYQNEFEYIFDSSKFENYFKIKPTPYKEGITESVH